MIIDGPSGRWSDLDRPPLRAAALDAQLRGVAPWRELRVLEESPSTNDVCAAAARAGEAEGLVVVAEHQSAGRGRLDRRWESPPRAGLTLSLLLRPQVPPDRRPWCALVVAAAAARAAGERVGLDVGLKWPNDLLVEDRKVAGVLAEAHGDAVVVGLGLNVSTRREELPRADATSLALETGAAVDRGPLLLALLRAIGPDYQRWSAAGGHVPSLEDGYRAACVTVGRDVRVELPTGPALVGRAVGVDDAGRLVVADADGTTTPVAAGDVVHVRPTTA